MFSRVLPGPRALVALALPALAAAGVTYSVPGFNATYPHDKVIFGTEIGFPSIWVEIPAKKEYYLDYEVFFENDWEWVKGGKLPGLVGGKHTSGCDNIVPDGWSARFMWREGGQGQLYLYHQNRRSGCGDEYDFSSPGSFVKNKWNRITQRVVINTPGQRDGLVECWYNGRKAVTLANVQLRGRVGENVALIDQVSLQTFYGGHDRSWLPSHDTHAKFSVFLLRDDLPDFSKPFNETVATLPRLRAAGHTLQAEKSDFDVSGRRIRMHESAFGARFGLVPLR